MKNTICKKNLIIFLLPVIFCLWSNTAIAEVKLTASDGASYDYFGFSASANGEYAIIGAYRDDDYGSESGSAYIFKHNADDSWAEMQKLTASDGASSDIFGYAVSISGDFALVGADCDDDMGSGSGSAYIFRRNGDDSWAQVDKLTASDGAASDYFGQAVSISGDFALIGAFRDDDNGTDSGSAYIFKRNGDDSWAQVDKLTASDGAASDYFGCSVSISGDYALIGAYQDLATAGSAYIFKRNGDDSWAQISKLTASDGAYSDYFGYSVSLSGDYAVIGAYGDDDKGSSAGSAYIFRRNGDDSWAQIDKLTAIDGMSYDYFGHSVSLSKDYAIIGAYNDDDKGSDSGSAYIFWRNSDNSWSLVQKLTSSDGAESDYFGKSVSIFENFAVVGAYGDDDNASASGSAYIYKIIDTDQDGLLDSSENSSCTDSNNSDTDNDGLLDGYEVYGPEDTDPCDRDTDGDGIQDGTEQGVTLADIGPDTDTNIFQPDLDPSTICTNPNDADTDDDGIADGDEDADHNGRIDPGETDPCNNDTDGDGIQDGTERGVTLADIGPDTDTNIFQPDLDTSTICTNPNDADTDDDGIADGNEDADHNGIIDPGETDPCNNDTDGDGIQDGTERGVTLADIGPDTDTDIFQPDLDTSTICTNPNDADTDDDGIADGDEDANHNGIIDPGETDPCNNDTDGDGIQDGTERGVTLADIGTDTDTDLFQPDLDSSTTTDPLNPDTDGDGLKDGEEDKNKNGFIDPEERDPEVRDSLFDSDSANFYNNYFPAISIQYAGTGTWTGFERYMEFLAVEVVDNVDCRKILVKGHGNQPDPELDPEWYYLWLAEDTDHCVWLFQAYDAIADQTITYGKAGAYLYMPANPIEGQKYFQNGPDYHEVIETNIEISQLPTGPGPVSGCLKVKVVQNNGTDEDTQYIAPGIGVVKEEKNNNGEINGWEMAEIPPEFHSEAKLTASDGAASDYFGRSVSISGDYAIVGAEHDDTPGTDSGSAYIFKRNGDDSWAQVDKLTASDGWSWDYFGHSVFLSGDYAIVGAYEDDFSGASSVGSAYIFKRNGDDSWAQVQKLTASDGAASDYFGRSVSISGDYAVVGADNDDDNGSNSGSAYIFKRNGDDSWAQVQKLTASDGAASDSFGRSVSLSGDYAVVGATGDDDNGLASGSAYIFKRNGDDSWTQLAKVTASDGDEYDSFGGSVCLSGDYAVIGATGDDDNGSASGSAYIFKRNGDDSWAQLAKVTASDGAENDSFGGSVCLSGDYAVVGAYGDDDNGPSSGSAYIFKRNGDDSWAQLAKVAASDGDEYDHYAESVSLSGEYAVIGAYGDDDMGSDAGSAYVYKIVDTDQDGLLDDSENAGCTDFNDADTDNDGITDTNEFFDPGKINPCDIDTDGDGIQDGTERGVTFADIGPDTDTSIFQPDLDPSTICTNVKDADTDDDGISDGDEDNNHNGMVDNNETDPCNSDSDGDGIQDGTERGVTLADIGPDTDTDLFQPDLDPLTTTDPLSMDTDGDGLTDGNEDLNKNGIIDPEERDPGLRDNLFDSDSANFYNTYFPEISIQYAGTGTWTGFERYTEFLAVEVVDNVNCRKVLFKGHGNQPDPELDPEWYYLWLAEDTDHGVWLFQVYNAMTDQTITYGKDGAYLYMPANPAAGQKYFQNGPDYHEVLETNVEVSQLPTGPGPVSGCLKVKVIQNNGADEDIQYIKPGIGVVKEEKNNNGEINGWEMAEIPPEIHFEIKLTASDGWASDYFGRSVSISGDYAVVGAEHDDIHGTDSGSAYIFKRNGDDSWAQVDKLTPDDGAVSDYFGYAVSISGEYAIVGAYQDDARSGSAYIFKRNGDDSWVQVQKLTASDGVASDYFGYSVSISGEYAIVGAYQDDDNGSSSGSAYIFKRNGELWVQLQKSTATDGASSDYFGYSVSISGDDAIVGAYQDNDNGSSSGSAYIFKRNGDDSWAQVDKLTPDGGAASDYFGYSVSISGEYAIVGAYQDDDNGSFSGSAYIFKRNGDDSWLQIDKLTATDGAELDYFGIAVSLSGDYAIIGAHGDDDNGSSSGSVYIFGKNENDSWSQLAKVAPSDGSSSDYFGKSVCLSGEYAVIGVYGDDDKGTGSGSAYVYKIVDTDQDGLLDGSENSGCTDFNDADTDNDGIKDGGELSDAVKSNPCDMDTDGDGIQDGTERGVTLADIGPDTDTDVFQPDLDPSSICTNPNDTDSDDDGITDGDEDADHNGIMDPGETDPCNHDTDGDGIQDGTESGLTLADIAPDTDTDVFQPDLDPSTTTDSLNPDTDGDGLKDGEEDPNKNGLIDPGERDPETRDQIFDSNSATFNNQYVPSVSKIYSGTGTWDGFSRYTEFLGVEAVDNVDCRKVLIKGHGNHPDPDSDPEWYYLWLAEDTDQVIWLFQVYDAVTDQTFTYGEAGAYLYMPANPVAGQKYFQNGPDYHEVLETNVEVSLLKTGPGPVPGCLKVKVVQDGGTDEDIQYIKQGIGVVKEEKNNNGEINGWELSEIPPNINFEIKLTASDGAASDTFGNCVSISGDDAIVGAYQDDDNGSSSGSAYIFERNGDDSWAHVGKLTPGDGAASDYFGRSVSISGDYAIVGAYQDDDKGSSSGSAYIFKRNGDDSWTQVDKLAPDDGAASDYFGYAVSISGDDAIVGAYQDDDKGYNSGSAYIFKRDGELWTQVQKLTATDGASSDYFGHSVSISGDDAVVGAYQDDDKGYNSGSAYIFKRNGELWTQGQKLTASDGASSDSFGSSVTLSGDYAVVGAYQDDDNGSSSGSAYIFKRNGDDSWTQVDKLAASDGASEDNFGGSVSISGDYAIVGSNADDDNGSNSGSVYIFRNNGNDSWMQVDKLTASDGAATDYFGGSVSISGDYAIVGASADDDNGSNSGSAYIFKIVDTDQDGLLDGSENSGCTDFNDADTDNDGIIDGDEALGPEETNPCNIDSDGDGIQDGTERGVTLADIGPDTDVAVFQPDLDPSSICTDPDDADTDDDGISDGAEDANHNGMIDNSETDPCMIDSDNDGLQDGTELGVTLADIGPDTDVAVFQPDLGPSSICTDPDDADTDDDGILDGNEDINHNGTKDPGETDPCHVDTDGDGIQDGIERGVTLADIGPDTDIAIFQPDLDPSSICTNPDDADTDDDGIPDGEEDKNHNGQIDPGETDPCKTDTDNDGLQDGTELGVTLADIGPDTDIAIFQPDLDPSTQSDPLNPDVDSDGLTDGQEDANHNGQIDPGERDPATKDYVFDGNSANLTNTFLAGIPAGTFKYTGTGTWQRYGRYYKAIATETVDTVQCLKVLIRGHGNHLDPDLDPEWYYLWLAEDTAHCVWTLQAYNAIEDQTNIFGRAGAYLQMPAAPVAGQIYYPYDADYHEVLETDITVARLSTGYGPFNDCLKIKVVNEGGADEDIQYLVPDVGIVKEEKNDDGESNGWEMVDPSDPDNDKISNDIENAGCTDPEDADTDDDGIPDGDEDANQNGVVDPGETDPCKIDTDNDGIQDGTELGITLEDVGRDTDPGVFQPDLDPSTTTDPLDPDMDDDGLTDGQEDKNLNGQKDPDERDPGIKDNVFDENSAKLTNIYTPASLRTRLDYVGTGTAVWFKYYMQTLAVETVDNVKCLKVLLTSPYGPSQDPLSYYEYYWMAEDTDHCVWILKRYDSVNDYNYQTDYLYMPADPVVGQSYPTKKSYHTFEIVEQGLDLPQLGQGLGPYSNCLKVKESFTYPGYEDVDYHFFAPMSVLSNRLSITKGKQMDLTFQQSNKIRIRMAF
jgi:hypothetical protein